MFNFKMSYGKGQWNFDFGTDFSFLLVFTIAEKTAALSKKNTSTSIKTNHYCGIFHQYLALKYQNIPKNPSQLPFPNKNKKITNQTEFVQEFPSKSHKKSENFSEI